jgi:rare lipoprotein A
MGYTGKIILCCLAVLLLLSGCAQTAHYPSVKSNEGASSRKHVTNDGHKASNGKISVNRINLPDGQTPFGATERGMASYYSDQFHGAPTASGEIYNMNELTAAHPTLPFGSKVVVRNLKNGKSVEVRINDRGPFKGDRIIDLSKAAAIALDMVADGIAEVEIEAVK